MKTDMTPLIEGCHKMDINLRDDEIKVFDRYLDLLLEWNQKFNLTRITEPKDILVQHFLDSLSIIMLDIVKENDKVLDMGAGAGFPGIPLKIMIPSLKLTLVDSVKKKVGFLEEVVKELKLSDTLSLHERAENLGRDPKDRQAYDVVVSRAVAELRVLSEYCLPLVKVGGVFIAHKGPGATTEIENARDALQVLGGKVMECKQIDIPFSEKTHNLVVVKKVKDTPKSYPRITGKPKKEPL